MTQDLIERIQDRIEEARGKHPEFTKDHINIFSLLLEEAGEIAKAYNDRNREAYEEEIIDTIVILVRMYHAAQ